MAGTLIERFVPNVMFTDLDSHAGRKRVRSRHVRDVRSYRAAATVLLPWRATHIVTLYSVIVHYLDHTILIILCDIIL